MNPSADPSTLEPARPSTGPLPTNHELRQWQSEATRIAQTVDVASLAALARQIQDMQRVLTPTVMRHMSQAAVVARAVMPLGGSMQALQRTLDGCSLPVGGALASLAKTWSSISWLKLSDVELNIIGVSLAHLRELSQEYRRQRQRSIEDLARWPLARPRPHPSPSIEAQLVQQFERFGRRIQKLERRLTKPESLPDPLAACRIVVDVKRHVATVTRGRRRIRMSLECAESRVLSRLITSVSSEDAKRDQPNNRRGWVSSKQLVRILQTRSGSEADAADYLRKTISDLRGKIVNTLRQVGCTAERLDVIQCKRLPGRSHGCYRLGLSASKALS